jgi:hypothetical protein
MALQTTGLYNTGDAISLRIPVFIDDFQEESSPRDKLQIFGPCLLVI